MSKREERQHLQADLDRAFTNGGFLQIGESDEVYNLNTSEGWRIYEEACRKVGDLTTQVLIEESRK